MKFITFLDHLGSMFKIGAEKALAVEAKLLPMEEMATAAIAVVNPALGGTFEGILASVVKVEQVAKAVGASTGTGAQKLQAAIPAVEQAILSDPLFKGKTIANLDLWNKAILSITGSLADLMNSTAASAPAAEAVASTVAVPV